MTAPMTASADQAFTLPFKLTLAAQAAAGLVFGLAPLLATAAYASALGFSGDDRRRWWLARPGRRGRGFVLHRCFVLG